MENAPDREQLLAATAVLAAAAGSPLHLFDDDTLTLFVATIERAGRFVDTARALGAAEIDERSRHELGSLGLSFRNGHRRPVHFLERLTKAAQSELTQRVRLGHAIKPRLAMSGEILQPQHPTVAAGMLAGTVGRDSAAVIVRCLDQAAAHHADPEDVIIAESELVDIAETEPADIVAVHSRAWREALDPDGIEPREEERRKRRGITLGRERHGLVPITGMLTPTCASKLKALYSEANAPGATPRFLADEDVPQQATPQQASNEQFQPLDDRTPAATDVIVENGEHLRTIDDPRTREQRQHDVFEGVLTAGIRAVGTEPGQMRSTAAVTAIVHLADLTANQLSDLTNGEVTDMTGAGQRLPAEIRPFEPEFATAGALRPVTAQPERFGSAPLRALTLDDLPFMVEYDFTSPPRRDNPPGIRDFDTDYGPRSGYGWIDDIDEPASSDTIKMLVCEGGLRVILLDENGAALWTGREQRYFTDRQRIALAARDGGCVICGAPAAWCDAHHVDEWHADNGPTDIDNGVLLCPAHHTWIHHSDYELAMIDGRPHLRAPFAADPTRTWRPVGGNRIHLTRKLERPRRMQGPRAA